MTSSVQMVPLAVTILVCLHLAQGLNNGVALTPPMGWLSWERFECNTQCDTDPDNCISEKLLMTMADWIVKDGYKDVGYEYVSVDDCWLAMKRDSRGRLQPNAKRFPSGMKALADYLHQRGLKLGVYEDIGTHTCAGDPGSEGHLQIDAQTFAEWGVDMLKFDGCNADKEQYAYGYPAMSRFLNETGRPIVFSCEWPMYAKSKGAKVDYKLVAKTCNMFRDFTDIYDSWNSVSGMIGYFGDDPGNFSAVAGPGAWNDPDQLVIGNYGLSHDQERAQFAMWAIMASPLLMSVDLRTIRDSSKAILQNKRVIAINQDPMGIQGVRIKELGYVSIWTRPVIPKGSVAVAFLYTHSGGAPTKVSVKLSAIGLNHPQGYKISEVFDGVALGSFRPDSVFSCRVNPSGVYLIKATIQ